MLVWHNPNTSQEGEELTLDYQGVTDSHKQARAATCLCGARSCRGANLHLLHDPPFSLVGHCTGRRLHTPI